MVRIIIADDEPHFCTYMQNIIAWEEEGFEICAVCKNGKEVLSAFEKYNPDVVLLDINMPGIDGLTLGEILRKENSDIKIIFITGYSEFEYARKAIQLGAVEYILKPFSKDELMAVMEKIKLRIQQQAMAQYQRNIDLQIVREEILKKWICEINEKERARFEADLERIGIHFPYEYYQVQVLEIDTISSMWNNREDIELWKFGIKNILDELMEQNEWKQISFCGWEERIVSILNIEPEEYRKRAWEKGYKETQRQIERHLKGTVSIGAGTLEKGIEKVNVSYRNSLIALEEKFLRGNNAFILFEEVTEQNSQTNIYRLEIYDRLLKGLRKGDIEEIEELLRELEVEMQRTHLSSEYIYLILSGMMSVCLSYVTEMNGDIQKIGGMKFSPYTEMYKASSLEQCILYLKNTFKKVIHEYQSTTSKRKKEITEKVCDFIWEHYSDSQMTVESIAASIFLDPSYIRRVISSQLSCTVSDLISEVRMKEAARMIKETELSISMIAERVGYNEPGYFSRCFKKYYGITPRQFVEKNKQ